MCAEGVRGGRNRYATPGRARGTAGATSPAAGGQCLPKTRLTHLWPPHWATKFQVASNERSFGERTE